MYADLVTCSRAEYELIDAESQLYSGPPPDLLAAIAWETDDPDKVTVLHVWRTPEARGEFAFTKIMPLAQAGKVTSNPVRLKPLRLFMRDIDINLGDLKP